jgi:uncharacterized membrane protein YgaE (UPF0421/DUF939 family)
MREGLLPRVSPNLFNFRVSASRALAAFVFNLMKFSPKKKAKLKRNKK